MIDILKAAASVLVVVVPAGWILWLFLIRREAEPGAELDLDVDFVGKQDGKWLIEVVAKITNRAGVRHWYHQFRVVVRYILPEDDVTDGVERLNYQLYCKRSIDSRIDGRQRYFSNASYIDPRLTFRHSYVTFVPAEATFVWVQLKLVFPRRNGWQPWKKVEEVKNSQRLFKVPA